MARVSVSIWREGRGRWTWQVSGPAASTILAKGLASSRRQAQRDSTEALRRVAIPGAPAQAPHGRIPRLV